TISSSYQGTKQVVDLVGAGTLFQEQMDHRAGAKGVYTLKDRRWKLKPSFGYRAQLLKETADEKWGGGLFDYRRADFGLETEYAYKDPFAVRASFHYAMTTFPNYTSLESRAAFSLQGQDLARELVGDKVLDTHAYLFRLSAEAPYRGAVLEGSYALLSQRFPKQYVVDAAGNLTSPLRSDMTHALELGAKLPFEVAPRARLLASFDLGYTRSASNQNSYDALRAQFQEGYYDYSEFRVSPGARLLVGNPDRPVTMGLGMMFWIRDYAARKTQDTAGAYQSAALNSTSWLLSASVSRPIAPRVRVLFNFQYGAAYSNQRYETFYKYGYSAANYLFGVGYDF
ncbi:MAG: hypothetical protein AAB339_08460, partial [Elusimicrobiota bacterium]